MKEKLKKFSQFTADILPHEADYLLKVHQLQDAEKISVLQRIVYNCHHPSQPKPFDPVIDKRKYSHLMQWITQRLEGIDVDVHFAWINDMDRKVLTDQVTAKEERLLLRRFQEYEAPGYYFVKFFELALNFRHFLLIRLRHEEHVIVHEFVEKWRPLYNRALEVNEKLHQATIDIINQYSMTNTESRQWENYLRDIFYDESLDGRNRYFAVVRLTFMYFNYREFDKLRDLYDYLDDCLRHGIFYSRRILLNYYSNCVLLHSKYDVLQRAEEYGHWAIKQKNADHLKYLNTYSAILLRQGKIDQALSVMKESFPEMRHTDDVHNKVGFASFYMKCLNLNGQPHDAERFGSSFLDNYRSQILAQRWHVFFVAYLQSLIRQEKFDAILRVIKKYNILERDRAYENKVSYLPTVRWYFWLADYMEGGRSEEELNGNLHTSLKVHGENPHKMKLLAELISELKPIIPSVVNAIKSHSIKSMITI
ncbi:MAG TPA: hypothetical protein DCE41_03960 [Cytophagales bacterium]|nr:hypothetical protein [Cytophagales bacterium]HAA23151.1 hypothetical protein [Cytophagales bacterium]HAP57987.1 hypothetical protein [Cytophagales bacterium]